MVFTYCELCLQATQQRKIIPGACSTELPAKIVLPFRLEMDSGGVWRSLGRRLTGFCSLLGGFWPLLGTSWASLGHFLDALGCLLAALWSFTAAFRLPGPSQASILGHFWRALAVFFGVCGRGAGIAAKNPCWHSLSAFRFHPAARRYVRSTSAASRRESRAC